MKKKVPKKNIVPIIMDIKSPKVNYEHLLKIPVVNIPNVQLPGIQKERAIKKIAVFLFAIAIFAFLSLAAIGWYNLKTVEANFQKSAPTIIANITQSADSLKELNPEKTIANLHQNKEMLASLNSELTDGFKNQIIQFASNFIPVIGQGMTLLNQIGTLNLKLLFISEMVNDLKANGIHYLFNDGEKLINLLEMINNNIRDINELANNIKNNINILDTLTPLNFKNLTKDVEKNYLRYSTELYGLENVLSNILRILKQENTIHLAILFQNSAEARPGGGFLGSYADVAIKNGTIKNIDVRDIYDPDGQLDIKIVPPDELQSVTENWGARDANWFFDFPTSAKTVLNFLNSSKMYFEKNIKFEHAIALNINVIKSILELTGPIESKEYGTITPQNILYTIQNETEGGKDKKAGEPKRILKILTPLLIEKIQNLSAEEKNKLLTIFQKHIENKDIMFYSNNKVIQNILYTKELDGSVMRLPDNFWGSYLAVVNTNIAGGKSDAMVKEEVNVNIDMDTNGNLFSTVEVKRAHYGNQMKESWWRANNNNYIQIFTEPNASLVDIIGNDTKKKPKEIDYSNMNYAINPDLDMIQKTKKLISNFNVWQSEQFGKNVFGTYFIIKAGETKTLKIRYTTNYNKTLLSNDKYTFVFEKQSGVDNALNLTINAPFKYYWLESNSPIFTYKLDNVPKRLVLTLTLGYNKPVDENN